jgi:hypothetical protein
VTHIRAIVGVCREDNPADVLTTEDGIRTTNEIVLELEVARLLVHYLTKERIHGGVTR